MMRKSKRRRRREKVAATKVSIDERFAWQYFSSTVQSVVMDTIYSAELRLCSKKLGTKLVT